MTSTNEHPSTFEIDVWFADGESDDATAAHVRACTPCARYVEDLRELELGGLPAAPSRRFWRSRHFVAPFGAAMAMAAALALFVRWRSPLGDGNYVGVKGGSAVQVLVRSAGLTRVWDGSSTVHPGDAIAFRVACHPRERVTVASRTPKGWMRMRDERCPREPAVLPFTLVVDDEIGVERLAVVITEEGIRDDVLGSTIESPPSGTWVKRYDLAKEIRP